MNDIDKPIAAKSPSRRRFAKHAATALVAAPLAAHIAGAQTATPTPTPKEPVAPPNPSATPAPANSATLSPAANKLVEAYTDAARARFGEQLGEPELARVRGDLEGNVRVAERLRSFKLANADEPDFIFKA